MSSPDSPRSLTKVLIANRGEIALRIMKTLRAMGLQSVAVYSDVDADMPFARYADEAVHIGPATAAESYLVPERIIQAAKDTGADAIHPGYGFLSENAAFAEAAENAGIIFIGPRPNSIQTMGDKLSAKAAVAAQNVPLVPGSDGEVTDLDEAERLAQEIGFPVMVKASAGGGGKGMRVVHNPALLRSETERAMSEATSAFGNGAVFLERFVTEPRHIEIQVLCDAHGNGVHLFERECSIQRRHQKVVEEAPSALLDEDLRQRMGQCALDCAAACGYVGAGTVEFLVDAQRKFYFLEMNTRLQVEHPVTEMITGVDLVEEQIRIARGETLRLTQESLSIQGHAIELRVYAEDVPAGFLPSTGTLAAHIAPEGPGIRVDAGVETGDEISIYYDPMIAKLCAHGMDRNQAMERLRRAIDEYVIQGVETTLDFGRFVLDHPAFVSGKFDTGFVSTHFDTERFNAHHQARKAPLDWSAVSAVLDAAGNHASGEKKPAAANSAPASAWRGRYMD
ncbi:MAG: acetyl-CoA carboxylase biotin carboxylase subunit [Flavobacteriales bacterium]|nr:acetyl-CoA carboxylase biotin carboxylase subunit [Flavobacteriales bacterium]